MNINVDENTMCVFDLDDTLYKEIDFLKSAFLHISNLIEKEIGVNIYKDMIQYYFQKKIVFDEIKANYNFSFSIRDLINIYRFHIPVIKLSAGAIDCLEVLKAKNCKIGLITDGRSVTQRNKLAALEIENYFDIIVISEEVGTEKPNEINFRIIEDKFPMISKYIYIGDNFKKDFLVPNRRNWISIGLIDNGENIHSQDGEIEINYLPKHYISSLAEITFY